MFKYKILLYFDGSGPEKEIDFQADTPVQIGHEIDWNWLPANEYCEMTLKVFDITHRGGRTILFCEYEGDSRGDRLVSDLILIGIRPDNAREDAKIVDRKMEKRLEKYKLKKEKEG